MGLTVLHVTHDREEALALADRVVVLDSGRIQQVASPAELLERPASALVARFLSDATTVAGRRSADGFTAEAHPLRLDPARLDGDYPDGDCEVAILPDDVRIEPAAADGTTATVVSSLFGRTGNDVVLDWAGLPLRCRSEGFRPEVGADVRVHVDRAVAYARPAA
ncbi:hypothetical protein [Rathayibacter sp. VKM Ac-2630]|uniref:hypothetical protein n=1 Tax=Rathayibacter sp. VKM Ac-2630 TaxID=1938617 RepID=UPI001F416E38|nr:hypothetical protein [Rathayibacter sp. VKM Ac-2630]